MALRIINLSVTNYRRIQTNQMDKCRLNSLNLIVDMRKVKAQKLADHSVPLKQDKQYLKRKKSQSSAD